MKESEKYPCEVIIAPASDIRRTMRVNVHSEEELLKWQRARYEIIKILPKEYGVREE